MNYRSVFHRATSLIWLGGNTLTSNDKINTWGFFDDKILY